MRVFDPGTEVPCEQAPDVWFSDAVMDTKLAAKACTRCPVMQRCLEFGMNEEYGVWGGTTPYRRDILRRKIGSAA